MKARTALLILWLPWVPWLAAGAAAVSAATVVWSGHAPVADAGGGVQVATMTTSGAVSMDQAVKMVERRFHARVVKAETERDNGRTVYVLRLLSDSGRVWTVRVDAADGAVQ